MLIVYGSSTGNCEDAARQIARLFEGPTIKDVSSASADDLKEHDVLLLGTSTWGSGDIQDDFEPFVDVIAAANLSGKKVAIFGTGDPENYPDTFVSGLKPIYDAVIKAKGNVIGKVETGDYEYDFSDAVIDGHFVGLPLDYDNELEKVGTQISDWVNGLKGKL
jgi:flavodoxin I